MNATAYTAIAGLAIGAASALEARKGRHDLVGILLIGGVAFAVGYYLAHTALED